MTVAYGDPAVVIFPGLDQATDQIPVTLVPAVALLGPPVAAKTAGVIQPKARAKMRVTDVTFLNLSISGAFIGKR